MPSTMENDWRGLALMGVGVFTLRYVRLAKKPVIYSSNIMLKQKGKENVVDKIISKCPTLHQTYYPPLLLANPHVQVVAFVLTSLFHMAFPFIRWTSETVVLEDGENVFLDWANEIPAASSKSLQPVLMIHHGAGGNSHDFPNQTYVQEALDRGWKVCVFNRRGHRGKLTRPKFNFFGCNHDLRLVIGKHVKDKFPQAPVFMIGISAGSGLVARYMGDQGFNGYTASDEAAVGFCDAAIGVCPGYDIKHCMSKFQEPYKSMMLLGQKLYYLHKFSDILSGCVSYESCLQSSDVQTWLDQTWSMAGASSIENYYEESNPMVKAKYIRQPVLMLNSEDDPLCVIQNLYDSMNLFQEPDVNAAAVLTKTGSHCSFYEFTYDLRKWWLFSQSTWAERVVFEFLDEAYTVVMADRKSKSLC